MARGSTTQGGAGTAHQDFLIVDVRVRDPEPTDEEAYLAHERVVLAMLATRYRDIDPDGRREIYHEAWAAVLQRRRRGLPVDHLRAYLLGAADKLASKKVYGADARRRRTFDPDEPSFAGLADDGPQPDETVVAIDEARRVHLLIDELDAAQQAVLKLRLDAGLEPGEIRSRLGLTDRQYRRVAERAGRALQEQFQAFDRGDWARRQRSLLCACVMGIASERQHERARELVEADPSCRAMMSELRALGNQAAAVLPMPTGATAIAADHGGVGQRLADVAQGLGDHAEGARQRAIGTFSHVRRHVADALMGTKQHAAAAYARVSDPTPLTAVRPGAAAALVAGCLAAGGGTYCAVEGMPTGLGRPIGIEQSQADGRADEQAAREPASPPSEPTPDPPILPTEPGAQPDSSPQPQATPQASSPAPSTTTPAASPEPANEFEPTAASSAGEPAPVAIETPRQSAPAAPKPASGGGGEFSP